MVRSSSSHLCWWNRWKRVEAGGSGWNLVQYVSVAYQNLSIESRIRFNVMLVAQKGRGMICQIVPNPNKYSMAFQISRADLVNKQITAPHNKTSLSCFIHNWNCGVLAVLALHTSEEIEVTAFSRLIPEVRTTWSWREDDVVSSCRP